MKRNLITVYSVIISIIFGFAIIFLGLNLFSEYKNGTSRTEETFENLKKAIKNNGEDFNKNKLLGNFNSFSSIFIEKNGKILIVYPNTNAENAVNSRMIAVYSATVENFDDVYDIKAGLYLIRPEVIFYYARFSFIIIMIATILTTILIIYFSVSAPKTRTSEEKKNSVTSEPSGSSSDIASKETDKTSFIKPESNEITENNAEINQEKAFNTEADETIETQSESEKTDNFATESENSTDYGNNTVKETDSEAALENIDFSEPVVPVEEPLYSPVTGAQWESGLEKKLDDELVKAASSEQDLSLFEILVPELDYNDPKAKQIYDYILDQIQNQEYIFEYKEHGFAFIKTETNIDEAEDFAELIHQNIYDLVSERGLDCYIGISSRSIRMLSASRLIHEADQALSHAVKEKQPIIGFHVDIEKYKEFLKNSQN